MKRSCHILLSLLFLGWGICHVRAQDNVLENDGIQLPADDFIQFVEDQKNWSEEDLEDLYELYLEDRMAASSSHVRPNLNQASVQELLSLGFLRIEEVLALSRYIQDYGKIVSFQELDYIHLLSASSRELLKQRVVLGDVAKPELRWNDFKKYSRHKAVLRYRRVLKKSKAYREGSYLGSPDEFSFRYNGHLNEVLKFGFSADKDGGEPLFNKYNPYGFDFYSGYISFENLGRVKRLVLGNYRLRYGYGLSVDGGSFFPTLQDPSSLPRTGKGIQPTNSLAENSLFSGAALHLNLNARWDLHLAYAFNKVDGQLQQNKDSPLLFEITSISTSGYHRSLSELQKKRQLPRHFAFIATEGLFNRWRIGFGLSHTRFLYPLHLKKRLYNQKSSPTSPLEKAFAYYQFQGKKFSLFGEIGADTQKGWAILQGLQWNLHPTLHLLAHYRYCDPRFSNPQNNNESTGSIICAYQVLDYLHLRIEGVLFRKPWFSYPSKFPFSGGKLLARLNFQKGSFSAGLLYSYKDYSGIKRHQLCWTFQYQAEENWTLQIRLDGILPQKALLFYADLSYTFTGFPLRLQTRFALFDTQDYEHRLYAYEANVLYSMGVNSYYNRGHRFYFLFKYSPVDFFQIEGEFSYTHWDGVLQMGSGKDVLEGNWKPELCLQASFKF